jgi:HEAT repeat protein
VSQTTIILVLAAIAVIATIALFALRGGPDAVAVATTNADDDPALSASGEAMIVGDVMPIDSNEPSMPPGTAELPRADSVAPRRPAQVYEPRREPKPPRQPEPLPRQSERVEDPATPRDIRWAKRFEPRDGAFDDATRLSLIRDLGIVRAPWGVPLLTQAYEEEPALDHRRAALRALAAYRHPDTQPTFELALRADDEETRAIAANALTALSIRAALPS